MDYLPVQALHVPQIHQPVVERGPKAHVAAGRLHRAAVVVPAHDDVWNLHK